jgi:hypothetical protein
MHARAQGTQRTVIGSYCEVREKEVSLDRSQSRRAIRHKKERKDRQ